MRRINGRRANKERLRALALVMAGAWVARRVWQGADLRNQVVLINGGSRGLGLALAREFARQGCKVAISARDTVELGAADAELRAAGADVLALPCDVTDRAQVAKIVQDVTAYFGQIDILVNNAAIMTVGRVTSMTLADFEAAMDVMYWGMVYASFAVLPQMRRRRSGRIVNITSIGGRAAVPHMLPYSAAKFAGVGFSQGLRAELLQDGVIVTTVAPGLMRTGGTLHAEYKGDREAEFTWLNLADALPILSMDAGAAARRIVAAVRRGEAHVVTTLPAKVLSLLHGVAPGTMSNLFALANRTILPLGESPGAESGVRVRRRIPALLRWLMTLNLRAAPRLNQHAAPAYQVEREG